MTYHPAKRLRDGAYIVIARGAVDTVAAAALFDRAHAERRAVELATEKGAAVGTFLTVK